MSAQKLPGQLFDLVDLCGALTAALGVTREGLVVIRRELVGLLSAQGMSTRAIAPAVGVSQRQVSSDVRSNFSPSPGAVRDEVPYDPRHCRGRGGRGDQPHQPGHRGSGEGTARGCAHRPPLLWRWSGRCAQ